MLVHNNTLQRWHCG